MTEQVSFDDEMLILVDDSDQEVGSLTKEDCHKGEGKLHRAFSVFLINSKGEILLQQRSDKKKLWPNFWSNSCCSHPRLGESMELAAKRRLKQELNVESELKSLYKFKYQAQYLDVGSEHELCTVLIGHSDDAVDANENEIKAWEWVTPGAIDQKLEEDESQFTPWFKLEWKTLNENYLNELQ